jgi:hypothetical protein
MVGKKLPTLQFYIDRGKPGQKVKIQNINCRLKFVSAKIDTLFSKLLSTFF